MTYPAITAFFAAILGLVFVALSLWVIAGRFAKHALHGDGGDASLARRIRIQANFSEYVPLALLLVALLEASGASAILVRTLLVVLLIARVLHPVGMLAPLNSPQQFACRGGGIVATIGVVIVAAVALLTRV